MEDYCTCDECSGDNARKRVVELERRLSSSTLIDVENLDVYQTRDGSYIAVYSSEKLHFRAIGNSARAAFGTLAAVLKRDTK